MPKKRFQFLLRNYFPAIVWLSLFLVPLSHAIQDTQMSYGTIHRRALMVFVVLSSALLSTARFGAWTCCVASFFRCRVGDYKQLGTVLDFYVLMSPLGYLCYWTAIVMALVGIYLSNPNPNPGWKTLAKELLGYLVLGLAWVLLRVILMHDEGVITMSYEFLTVLCICIVGRFVEQLMLHLFALCSNQSCAG